MDILKLFNMIKESSEKLIKNTAALFVSLDVIRQLNSLTTVNSLDSISNDPAKTGPEINIKLFDYLKKVKTLVIFSNGMDNSEISAVFLNVFSGLIHLYVVNCDVSIFLDLFNLRNRLISLTFFKTNAFNTDELKLVSHSFAFQSNSNYWNILKSFNFQFSNIINLGGCFKYFKSLSSLDLSYNYLIDASSSELSPLSYLNLSSNYITKFPTYEAETLRSLTTIIISNNRLTSLKGVGYLINLKILYANDNFIKKKEGLEELYYLSSLNILKLKGNPIFYLEKYRISVASVLSPALARSTTFTLDSIAFSSTELAGIGDYMKNIGINSLGKSVSPSSIKQPNEPSPIIAVDEKEETSSSIDTIPLKDCNNTEDEPTVYISLVNSPSHDKKITDFRCSSMTEINESIDGGSNFSDVVEYYSFNDNPDVPAKLNLHRTSNIQKPSDSIESEDLPADTNKNIQKRANKDLISVKRLDEDADSSTVKYIKISGRELIELENESVVICTIDLQCLEKFTFDEKFVIKLEFDLLTVSKKNRVYLVEESQNKFNIICRKLSIFNFNYNRKNEATINTICLNCSNVNVIKSKAYEKLGACKFCGKPTLTLLKEASKLSSVKTQKPAVEVIKTSEPKEDGPISIINLIDFESFETVKPLLLKYLKTTIFASKKESLKVFIKGWLVTKKSTQIESSLCFVSENSLYLCIIESIKLVNNLESALRCTRTIDLKKIEKIIVGCSGQMIIIKLSEKKVYKIITAEGERAENFAQLLNDTQQLRVGNHKKQSNGILVREKLIESIYYKTLVESLIQLKDETMPLDTNDTDDTTPFCYRILWYFDLSQGSFTMVSLLTTRSCLFLIKEPYEDSIQKIRSIKSNSINLIRRQLFKNIKSIELFENAPNCLAMDFYIDKTNPDLFQQWLLLFHSKKSIDIFLSSLKVIWEEWLKKELVCTKSPIKDYLLAKIEPAIWNTI